MNPKLKHALFKTINVMFAAIVGMFVTALITESLTLAVINLLFCIGLFLALAK